MPPANSPSTPSLPASANSHRPRSPATPDSPPPLPQRVDTPPALSYLSSPVLDLAATLHTPATDDADEANVNFLRESLRTLDQAAAALSSATNRISNNQTSARHLSQPDQPLNSNTNAFHDNDDQSRREHLRRVFDRLNRHYGPSGPSTSAYSNRTPSPGRQSLYDWAPSHDDGLESEVMDEYLGELRHQQPETLPDILRILDRGNDGSSRRRERNAMSGELTEGERRERLRERTRRRRDPEWSSLHHRAIHRARQEASPSAAATTERMLRYVMERERSGMSEEEERARTAGWFDSGSSNRPPTDQQGTRSSTQSRDSWPVPPSASQLRADQQLIQTAQRLALENMRQGAPRISTPPVPAVPSNSNSPPKFLENALKYVNDLRSCYRYEDALSAAIDHGLALKEFFAEKHDDFIMDLEELEPLTTSCWLQPGLLFEGNQHATGGSPSLQQTTAFGNSPRFVEQINPNFPAHDYASVYGSTDWSRLSIEAIRNRPYLNLQRSPHWSSSIKSSDACHDNWPVRVKIHAVDYEKMTVQGTMEAYDVPQHPPYLLSLGSIDRPKAGKKNAPITTYLEGHLIDLRTHSFLTPSSDPKTKSDDESLPFGTINFPATNAETDGQNWRKLRPFAALSSDEDFARMLLSKAQMKELNEQYVFMRWKERCFVHGKDEKCSEAANGRPGDQDRGHGLTISGFYYVSLHRGSGEVEGLYFETTNTPYQCLKLKGSSSRWPSVGLR